MFGVVDSWVDVVPAVVAGVVSLAFVGLTAAALIGVPKKKEQQR